MKPNEIVEAISCYGLNHINGIYKLVEFYNINIVSYDVGYNLTTIIVDSTINIPESDIKNIFEADARLKVSNIQHQDITWKIFHESITVDPLLKERSICENYTKLLANDVVIWDMFKSNWVIGFKEDLTQEIENGGKGFRCVRHQNSILQSESYVCDFTNSANSAITKTFIVEKVKCKKCFNDTVWIFHGEVTNEWFI
jgi:hypothetical protein